MSKPNFFKLPHLDCTDESGRNALPSPESDVRLEIGTFLAFSKTGFKTFLHADLSFITFNQLSSSEKIFCTSGLEDFYILCNKL